MRGLFICVEGLRYRFCVITCFFLFVGFFFQAEDGIRDLVRSRGLGDVYKRQAFMFPPRWFLPYDALFQLITAFVALAVAMYALKAVSYTHLTLPTIYSV